MAFQKHKSNQMQYGNNPIGFEHHDPNVKDGPVTEIVKSAVKSKATDKLGEGFDAAWEKGAKFFTEPSINYSAGKTAQSAATQAAMNTSAAIAPSASAIAANAASAGTAPALMGSVMGAATPAAAAVPAMTAGAVAGGSTAAGLAGALPAMAALGPLAPLGLLIGGGLLASKLGGGGGHIKHLANNGGRIGMNTGMPVGGRDEVESARAAELERLRQAWLNRNNQGVTESLIPKARPYQSAMPVTKDWLSDLWSGTQGQSWDFPTERIDDVRFKGGPPDMIGPLSPYSNEDAKSQLDHALKQSESNAEQRRKDALNDAKIAKIQGETKKKPMNFSGTTSHIDGSNENIRIPDALVAEAQGYGVNTMGQGIDVSGIPKATYGGGWPPAWSGTPSYLTGDRQSFQGMAHEPWIDPAENPDNSYAPNRSIVPIARPMMNMSEADVEAGSVVQGAPLGMSREEVEARRQFKLEELRKESLGLNKGGKVCPSCGKSNCGCGYNSGGPVEYNHGGPLGRSQMMTPQAKAHAYAYDYYNQAEAADSQLRRYYGKHMVRSFPGEAPLSIRERIVDPILARTPIHRVTDYGKIKLDN